MEATEIRQLDELGRIVLPREFRRALAWGEEMHASQNHALRHQKTRRKHQAAPGCMFAFISFQS